MPVAGPPPDSIRNPPKSPALMVNRERTVASSRVNECIDVTLSTRSLVANRAVRPFTRVR